MCAWWLKSLTAQDCSVVVLESGGVDSALARVALLDTDLLPPPCSLKFFIFSALCVFWWLGACLTRVRTDDEGCT